MNKEKVKKIILYTSIIIVTIILSLACLGTVAKATGLVDDTINVGNEYSKYALNNYQLDFYVDNSWGWLPWNWGDGIGKQVMYGLYAITNFIWMISLYLSNATGYLVKEAYSLDFISQTADAIGKNMQTLAGVTKHGFSASGFYVGFLLILVFVLGIYVAYTGVLKRETTKAVKACINFVVVFLLSASFIAYAPDYVAKINDFSKDVSNASLELGTKIIMPNSESKGKDSVDLIRDSLFSIQVQQPWMLLQFDNSNIEEIGKERVEALVGVSPRENNGKDRENAVINEIENHKNTNLSITETINRLGMVFFMFIFNIGISIFVFLLTGIMIFSQVLFIVYAMFLPLSFLLSMIPGFESMSKKAVTKLFNVIMARAGITLIITIAFSISTMLYKLSADSPFFLIAFLQIVTFAGIYFKLGDLMSMFSLQSNESQGMGRQMMRRPRMFFNRQSRILQRKLGKSLALLGVGAGVASKTKQSKSNAPNTQTHERPTANQKKSLGKRLGEQVGNVADTKNRILDKAADSIESVKNTPTKMKYTVHNTKKKLRDNVQDFSNTATSTKRQKQEQRHAKRNHARANIAQKRQEMDEAKRQNKEKKMNSGLNTFK